MLVSPTTQFYGWAILLLVGLCVSVGSLRGGVAMAEAGILSVPTLYDLDLNTLMSMAVYGCVVL